MPLSSSNLARTFQVRKSQQLSKVAFARYLLDDAHVAAVPGAAYGFSPFVRLSTATSDENLSETVARIAGSVSKLKRATESTPDVTDLVPSQQASQGVRAGLLLMQATW